MLRRYRTAPRVEVKARQVGNALTNVGGRAWSAFRTAALDNSGRGGRPARETPRKISTARSAPAVKSCRGGRSARLFFGPCPRVSTSIMPHERVSYAAIAATIFFGLVLLDSASLLIAPLARFTPFSKTSCSPTDSPFASLPNVSSSLLQGASDPRRICHVSLSS